VTRDGQTVTVSLAGLAARSAATLVFRLVNNDGDTNTSVRLSRVEVDAGAGSAVDSVPGQAQRAAPSAVNFASLVDVSASMTPEDGQTSFASDSQVTFTELGLRNHGQYTVNRPL
jgi:hypothetical protein